MAFFNFFLIPVAQEYHNKWAPTLNGQKKWKTLGKLPKITNLWTPDWIQPNWMTLYKSMILISIQSTMQSSITKLNQSKKASALVYFLLFTFMMAWRQPNKSVKTGYPGKFWRHIIANSTALRNKSGFGLMKLRVFSWTGNQAVEIWQFLEVLFAHCIFFHSKIFSLQRDERWRLKYDVK